jgi:hypothetical protein
LGRAQVDAGDGLVGAHHRNAAMPVDSRKAAGPV